MVSPRRPGSLRGSRLPLYAAVLLVFGGLCIYAAVGVWLGVAQAVDGSRTPGIVRNVQCGGGRSSSCSGTFTSSDGRIQNLHVRVSDGQSAPRAAHGVLVRKIDTGLVGAIQSDDTVYLHGVDIDVVGSIVIGILLSVLGIAVLLPFLAIGVLMALGRRPR